MIDVFFVFCFFFWGFSVCLVEFYEPHGIFKHLAVDGHVGRGDCGVDGFGDCSVNVVAEKASDQRKHNPFHSPPQPLVALQLEPTYNQCIGQCISIMVNV